MAAILTLKQIAELLGFFHEKQELFHQARAKRRALKRNFGPEFDAAAQFKLHLWKRLLPNRETRSIEGFNLDALRDAAQGGDYDKMDKLNAKLVPVLKEYRLLKAAESAAESEADKAERDWQHEEKRRQKHAAKQKVNKSGQGRLVL